MNVVTINRVECFDYELNPYAAITENLPTITKEQSQIIEESRTRLKVRSLAFELFFIIKNKDLFRNVLFSILVPVLAIGEIWRTDNTANKVFKLLLIIDFLMVASLTRIVTLLPRAAYIAWQRECHPVYQLLKTIHLTTQQLTSDIVKITMTNRDSKLRKSIYVPLYDLSSLYDYDLPKDFYKVIEKSVEIFSDHHCGANCPCSTNVCNTCRDDLLENQELKSGSCCQVVMHKECIEGWASQCWNTNKLPTCPTCREEIAVD